MSSPIRWQPCVNHRPDEVEEFVSSYFGGAAAKTVLIAGAGFDPRATTVASLLRKYCKSYTGRRVRQGGTSKS